MVVWRVVNDHKPGFTLPFIIQMFDEEDVFSIINEILRFSANYFIGVGETTSKNL